MKQYSPLVVLVALGAIFWVYFLWPIKDPQPQTNSIPITAPTTPIKPIKQGLGATQNKCTSTNGLPDLKCTPGAINSDITQANIGDNICNPNWSTKSIRPPTSYTNKLKAQGIKDYGYTDTAMGSYEEDHDISLEIGGSPTSPLNLWPEPYAGDFGAKKKDSVENFLHQEVCKKIILLKRAQEIISQNWVECYKNIQASGQCL